VRGRVEGKGFPSILRSSGSKDTLKGKYGVKATPSISKDYAEHYSFSIAKRGVNIDGKGVCRCNPPYVQPREILSVRACIGRKKIFAIDCFRDRSTPTTQ